MLRVFEDRRDIGVTVGAALAFSNPQGEVHNTRRLAAFVSKYLGGGVSLNEIDDWTLEELNDHVDITTEFIELENGKGRKKGEIEGWDPSSGYDADSWSDT